MRSARQFLGLHYLWGGLSAWGYDCSGLTWAAYRAHGITIEDRRMFDHEQDRTFELKLAGPSRQFEIATAALLSLDHIYGVHID